MTDGIILSYKEIKDIVDVLPKENRLEVYRILKNTYFSHKTTKDDLNIFKKKIGEYLKKKDTPRCLTDKEIEEVLSVIKPLPSPIKLIAEDNLRQLKEILSYKLKQNKFSVKDDTLDKIKQYIKKQYLTSLCPYGESVGANSAMSISQPLTQATLNTFHSSGSSNKQAGTLKYLESLFAVSKPSKDITVAHFKDKNITYEEMVILTNSLKGVSVKDVIVSEQILSSLTPEDNIMYENYLKVMNTNFIYKGKKFLRIQLNLKECYKYNIFINDVVRAIEKNSKTTELRQAIKCIASSTYKGIIDIHVDPEFIKFSLTKKDSNLPLSGNIEDLNNIFLSTWLPGRFKEMFVKGIKDIDYISISDPTNLNTTYREEPVLDSVSLEKYSKKPYNLKLEDAGRLWRINLDKKALLTKGIKSEQYINLFESVDIKIIDSDIKQRTLIVLLPQKLEVYYYDEKDNNKIKNLYSMKEGILYDEKNDKKVDGIGPIKLIENHLEFAIKDLAVKIKTIFNDITNNSIDLPTIPNVYRTAYYYYITIEGKNIIGELMNNKVLDTPFTYPDNVNNVYNTLGIEAARFYLISKYNESEITSGGNPVNIELLIDYQTTLGRLLPVSFIGVNKAGGSILSEVGFEQAMDVLQRNSAFGNIDNLKGLTGSVMTGKFCHNGTGFSNITYDKEYLKDEDNKRITGEENKNIPLETDFVVGPCYKTISEDLNIDYKRKDMQDDINFNLPEEGKESELCLKENIPDPPRMEAPEIFSPVQNEEVDIQLPEKENYDVFADLEIPEDPGELESDYF